MTLTFPNPSRSFDETRSAVRFVGHDGMFEVRFLIETDALARPGTALRPKGMPEANYLSAFDEFRASIYDVAIKTYSRTRRDSYTLTASDFR